MRCYFYIHIPMTSKSISTSSDPKPPRRVFIRYKKRKQSVIRKLYARKNNQHSGTWNLQETKLYVQFIKEHSYMFESVVERRKSRVFYEMSKYVLSRTPQQCRSHHQKKILEYGRLGEIVKRYEC